MLPVVTHNIPGSASNAGYVQASAVDVPPSSSSNDMGTYAGPPMVHHPEQPDASAAAVIGGTVTPPGPALDPGDATSAPDTMDYEDIQAQKDYDAKVDKLVAEALMKEMPPGFSTIIKRAAADLAKDFQTLAQKKLAWEKHRKELSVYNAWKWPAGSAKMRDPFQSDVNALPVSVVGDKEFQVDCKFGVKLNIKIPEGVSYTDFRESLRMAENAVQKGLDAEITWFIMIKLKSRCTIDHFMNKIVHKYSERIEESINGVPIPQSIATTLWARNPIVESQARLAYKKVYDNACREENLMIARRNAINADTQKVYAETLRLSPIDHLEAAWATKGKGRGGGKRATAPESQAKFTVDHFKLFQKKAAGLAGHEANEVITDSITISGINQKNGSSPPNPKPSGKGGAQSREPKGSGKKAEKAESKGKDGKGKKGKEKGKGKENSEKAKGKGKGKTGGKMRRGRGRQ